MPHISIRKASLSDLSEIQRLNHELFELESANFDSDLNVGYALGEEGEQYFSDMIKKNFLIVAFDEDKVIGYLAGTLNKEESITNSKLSKIDNMFIKESYRGSGIGKILVDAFKANCKTQGRRAIRVTASAKNKSAIAFYNKNGFIEDSITFEYKI